MNNFRLLLIACCAILAACSQQKFAFRKTYPADSHTAISRQKQPVPAIIETRIASPEQASASVETGIEISAISPSPSLHNGVNRLPKPAYQTPVSIHTKSAPLQKQYDGKPTLKYSNPWATIGFAFSVLGLFVYPIIFCGMGIILCLASLTRPGKRGFATAGIIIGVIGFLVGFWLVASAYAYLNS